MGPDDSSENPKMKNIEAVEENEQQKDEEA
jgi:hypothetical protein